MFGNKSKQEAAQLRLQLQNLQTAYNSMHAEYETLSRLINAAGGTDTVSLARHASELRSAISRDSAMFEEGKAQNLAAINAERLQFRSEIDALNSQRVAAEHELRIKQTQLDELRATYQDATIMIDAGLTAYVNPARNSVSIGAELDQVRTRTKELVRSKSAVHATDNFTFNGSTAQGRKFVSDMSTMMLRSYNAEAENCILTVKAGNGEAARKRLDRARDQAAKLGSLISLSIDAEYHMLRHRELALTLEYLNAKKAEKDAEREERARLREEAKAQKELEAARAKLTKERDHYSTALAALIAQGRDEEAAALRDKLEEINTQIESVDFRAANIRAGYVYVISNIGAFGERMVKIGMTRRLEPMDRVRELGDASVPFNFDVHALFFSEDAVGIETQLHQHFASRRVNKINSRREFFYATPAEVKDVLLTVTGNLLEFRDTAEAEQYRLSQAMGD